MTTEEQFQARLDEHPDDHTARLVFADRLDEQDPPDPRAAGYRELGKTRVRAHFYSGIRKWGFLSKSWVVEMKAQAVGLGPLAYVWADAAAVADEWLARAADKKGADRVKYFYTPWADTRREAEDDLAAACVPELATVE